LRLGFTPELPQRLKPALPTAGVARLMQDPLKEVYHTLMDD